MPDEGEQPQDGQAGPASDPTQQLGPDLTKGAPPPPPPAQPPPPPGWQPPPSSPQPGASDGAQYGGPQYAPPQYGPPQYAPPQYAPPQGYAQPYGQAQGQPVAYGPTGPTTSGKATTVLVLGVASLVLVFMCGVGLVTSIIALVMAPGAKREIEASQGRLTGLGMVQGGKVCSWIAIALVLLFVAVWVLLLAVGASISNDYPYSDI